jgi:hypothetical protein
VGDGLQGEVEGVFHAHRPRGGLLQIQDITHGDGFSKCPCPDRQPQPIVKIGIGTGFYRKYKVFLTKSLI